MKTTRTSFNGPDLFEFGRELLATRDIDPVYIILHEAQLEPLTLRRWILAYCCFYHVGTASWITDEGERGKFWRAMNTAACNKEYPRGRERRHFRGTNAQRSVEYLNHVGLGELYGPFTSPGWKSIDYVMAQVRKWEGFGTWAAFKFADLLERMALAQINFNRGALHMFYSPKQGAKVAYELYGEGKPLRPKAVGYPVQTKGEWAVNRILAELGPIPAPPRYERPINVQEAETILCKWHAACNGKYEIGEDIRSVERALIPFNHFPINHRLSRAFHSSGLYRHLHPLRPVGRPPKRPKAGTVST